MTERLRGGQVAIRTLEANGVDTVFGIPGVHTLELYDALLDSSINHILARHEQGAGFMADGYARASGKPGVAIIITGPGITNVATPVGEAYTDSVPVFVLSSNVELEWADKMLGHLHDLKDQLGVMRAVTKWNDRAKSVEEVRDLVNRAFKEMLEGRPRPTHVEIPLDVLSNFGDADIDGATIKDTVGPDNLSIQHTVELLKSCDKPVIYAGGGAVSSNARAALENLASKLNAPVIQSTMGKGSTSDRHLMTIGNLWSVGNPVDDMLRQADIMLVFGSKLGAQETDYQKLPVPENLVRVDIDSTEVSRNYPAKVEIVADARLTAEALYRSVSENDIQTRGWTAEEVAHIKSEARENASTPDKRAYVDAIRNAIPDDGILATDMTMMSYVSGQLYPVYEPRTFFFPSGYGTLGYSVPAALGAKVACPDKKVVAIIGDGGFQYTMHELATAVQFRLGVPIVIFNDSTYTAVKEAQATEHDRRYIAVDLVNPDFGKLAEAYGIPTVRADSPEALQQAIEEAYDRDLPTLIDTPISFDY